MNAAIGDVGFLLIVGAVVGVLHWEAARHIWRSLRKAKRFVETAADTVLDKTVDEHADEAIAAVAEPPGTALESLLAWASDQDRHLCEALYAMPEANEPRRRT